MYNSRETLWNNQICQKIPLTLKGTFFLKHPVHVWAGPLMSIQASHIQYQDP